MELSKPLKEGSLEMCLLTIIPRCCATDALVNDSFVFDPLYSHFPDWFQVRFMADHRMYYLSFISSMDTGFIGDATFGWELDGENAWPILVPAILPIRRWEGDEEMQYTR